MRKLILGLLMAVAVVMSGCNLAGYEDEWVASEVYQPRYFGENGTCYFIDYPYEVDALVVDGLCQPHWRVAQAPAYWVARYAPFYDSPAYYNVYVRPNDRAAFTSRHVAWERLNKGLIEAERKNATWIDAKRQPVPGTKINYATSSFGSGRLRSTGFEAGGLRAPKGSGTGPPPKVKVVTSGGGLLSNRGTGIGGTKVKSSGFSSGTLRTGSSSSTRITTTRR